MIESKRLSVVKPTVHTRYHIDFDWWRKNDRDWRVYLQSYLCPQHQESFQDAREGELIDWIDPQTAEVQRVDGLQHVLIGHCAQQPDFITQRTSMVDAVFRIFLSNGNAALSCEELAERLNRPADTILRTLSGIRVYKGLRPIMEA